MEVTTSVETAGVILMEQDSVIPAKIEIKMEYAINHSD